MTWLQKSVSVTGTALLCALVAPACETNDSILFIMGVMDVKSNDCSARPEAAARLQAGGVVDFALRSNYTAALLIGSQLTQRGSREQLRTETARLVLKGAEVELDDANGTPLNLGAAGNPFSVFGTGFANPASGTEPGYGSVFVDLIPGSVSDAVPNGVVLAKVRVFGTTLGNQEIESNEFTFPIQVCRGCLITYPPPVGDPGRVQCAAGADADGEVNTCLVGQESRVPCSFCSTASQECSDACLNCAYRAGLTDEQCRNSPVPNCP